MRRYKVAAILMIVHGGAIELGGCLSLALALFMLPAGIFDSILSCSALVLIVMQYFGKRKIIE